MALLESTSRETGAAVVAGEVLLEISGLCAQAAGKDLTLAEQLPLQVERDLGHQEFAARATVAERFSRERNGQALVRLYQEVVGERRSPEPTAAASAAAIAVAPVRALAARVRRKAEYLFGASRRTAARGPCPARRRAGRAERVLVVCTATSSAVRSRRAAIDRPVRDRSRAITIASAGLIKEPGRPSHSLAIETAAPLRVDLAITPRGCSPAKTSRAPTPSSSRIRSADRRLPPIRRRPRRSSSSPPGGGYAARSS